MRIVLALTILLVLFIFGIFNAQLVQLILFNYQTPHLPLFLVLIFVFFLGFFLSALYYSVKVTLLRRQLSQLQREKDAVQKELHAGAAQPYREWCGTRLFGQAAIFVLICPRC
jgi:uncharacterized integral membrane protein